MSLQDTIHTAVAAETMVVNKQQASAEDAEAIIWDGLATRSSRHSISLISQIPVRMT